MSYRSTTSTDGNNSFTSTDKFVPSDDLLKEIGNGSKTRDELRPLEEHRKELEKWFPYTPAVFWSETCVKHNGFFGMHTSNPAALIPKPSPTSSSIDQTATSAAADRQNVVPTSGTPGLIREPSLSSSSTEQTETAAAGEHQVVLSTYFRLIVKMLLSAKASVQGPIQAQVPASNEKEKDYKWYEMGFMSRGSVLLCCNVPGDSIKKLFDRLPTDVEQIKGPFALHIPLLEVLAELFDESVWSMTKKVRGIEEVSSYERPENNRAADLLF